MISLIPCELKFRLVIFLMIALLDFKALLGQAGATLSDAEVEQLRTQMVQMADMAFDVWIAKQNTQKVALIREV
jgi:hypothetical protein